MNTGGINEYEIVSILSRSQSHEDHMAGPLILSAWTECSVVCPGIETCRRLGRGRPVGRGIDEDDQRNQGTK